MKTTWLKENITSLLALFWSVASFTVLLLILTKDIKTDDKTTYLIIGMINSIIMLMLGYYWGSSKASNDKIKQDQNIEDASATVTIKSKAPIEEIPNP